MRRTLLLALCLLLAGPADRAARALSEPTPPPAHAVRPVPGLNAPDEFPEACVGCHVERSMLGVDSRLSTAMKGWAEKVDPDLVAKVQGTLPEGTTLRGKHPSVTRALSDVPAACIRCHKINPKAPPFPAMMHVIHLTGGDENRFLTRFQGQCTHCHKLDAKTGVWTVPSGPEKGAAAGGS